MVHSCSISSCLNGCVMVYTAAIQGHQERLFGTNVYVVRVALAQELIADIPATGLSGTVEIKTGERRVLSYFLDPIIDSWDKSLKEP